MFRRLTEHETGKSKSTRKKLPVKLIHLEQFETRILARKKEVYIKKRGAGRYLNLLKFSPEFSTQPPRLASLDG